MIGGKAFRSGRDPGHDQGLPTDHQFLIGGDIPQCLIDFGINQR